MVIFFLITSSSFVQLGRGQICASSNVATCRGDSSKATESVAVPFADAAVWAASLVLDSCDQVDGNCDWEGVGDTWRYIFNNMLLALRSVDPNMLVTLPFDVGVLQQIYGFIGQIGHDGSLWQANWPQAVSVARQAVQAFNEWWTSNFLSSAIPEMPKDIGTRFPTIGRHSMHVPTDGDWGSTVTLTNGFRMPMLGFGVWRMKQGDRPGIAYQSVLSALQAGYRHLDTAQNYGNEEEVGRALRDSGVPRGEVCLVTKLSHKRGYTNARGVFLEQLSKLGVSYVDVYMLHHPVVATREEQKAAWAQLEQLYDEGKVKALGVSNVDIDLLMDFLSFARVKPMYVQNKYSIYHPAHSLDHDSRAWQANASIMEVLVKENIVMTGYSTIRPGHHSYLNPLEDPHVLALATKHGRTSAQIMHRWLLQLGVAIIPSSSKQSRIVENGDVFNFALSETDMRLLNGIASLVSSSPNSFTPSWCDDVYSIQQLVEWRT